MPNYKETSISGSSYTRCSQVTIINKIATIPIIKFEEEEIILLSSGNLNKNNGQIEVLFDSSRIIEVFDPVSGVKTTQTVTLGEIYALVYSVYMNEALSRDAIIEAAKLKAQQNTII